MAVSNINLQSEIQDWKEAVYGEEVRAANVSAFEKIQGIVNDTVQEVNTAAAGVKETTALAQQTITSSQTTLNAANRAVTQAQESADNASDSATQAQSWTVGGTGSREGENSNNSKYYSEQAGQQAERARTYADVIEPSFIIENNRLYMKQNSTLTFVVFDNRLCWKIA